MTLTGAPGIGKSRLALELAGRLGGDYPEGARLVELAPISRPGDVARAAATALSIDEVAGQSLTDTLRARLRRRRVLLVLDNCEHLLGACAELSELLLGGCPQLRILATSREPLKLAGERIWQVPPLAVPPKEDAPPETLSGYAAVALFRERAASAQPGFSLNPYLAPAVAEICRRLDGIPLAIELAAGRVESLTPQEIASRLNYRFDLLTEGGPSDLAHHQTLEAALDWSHELLSAPERALLRRLSVFPGGFEPPAVAGVCAGGQVKNGQIRELLARLVAKSLVVAEQNGAPQARYRLLETIRAYASERLEKGGETAALRQAHAGFYLALAEEAEPELTGARQQEWLERLEGERANVRSALEWSLSHGREEWALRLAGALVLFWRVRCHFSEGRELLSAALSASGGAAPELRARALWGKGFMVLMAGDPEGAFPPVEESLARFRELDDRRGCARALLILGSCHQQRGDADASRLLEESAAEAREASDSWCLAHALALAGFHHHGRSDPSAARALFEECLSVARAAQDKQGLRFGLNGLGQIALSQGDFGSAESLLEEAVAVNGELGEDYSKAIAMSDLARLGIVRGDYRRAGELLDEALALMRELGDCPPLPSLLALRGSAAHAEGDRSRARPLLEEALAVARAGGGTHVGALQSLAELSTDEGDLGAARRLFEEALELTRGAGNTWGAACALIGLGQLARAEGEPERAAMCHQEALRLQREIGKASVTPVSLEAIAGLAAEAGRFEQAAGLFGAAKAVRERTGYAARWGPSRDEADLALVRERLPPEEFEAAFAKGAERPLEEADEACKGTASLGPTEGEWLSLTEREQQVAVLVAEGLSNPEIAERLFISRETVKRHMRHVFRKLGLAGRTELAREAWRRG